MMKLSGHPVRKAGFLFCSALAAMLALGACTAAANPPQSTGVPSSQPADLAATPEFASYPFAYNDVLGRSVTIDARPERIVSLAPSMTEVLYAIGAGAQVVGRTDYDNYPPEVESVASVGGFDASSISVETVVAMEPDLVVGGSIYQADLANALESAGLTVIVLEPAGITDILTTIQVLGAITGHQSEADTLIAAMQTRIDAVTGKLSAIPEDEHPLVFYEVWHEPLMTASNQTYIGELIALAGGVNIFGDLEEDYPTISAEQIIEKNPDIILGPSSHSDQLTAEMIATRPGWESLTAVQNGAVIIIDGDIISRAGPRIVDALEAIAEALHPELFQ